MESEYVCKRKQDHGTPRTEQLPSSYSVVSSLQIGSEAHTQQKPRGRWTVQLKQLAAVKAAS
jgi:hypothetical protein